MQGTSRAIVNTDQFNVSSRFTHLNFNMNNRRLLISWAWFVVIVFGVGRLLVSLISARVGWILNAAGVAIPTITTVLFWIDLIVALAISFAAFRWVVRRFILSPSLDNANES